MTVKRLGLMLTSCVIAMTMLIGGYRLIWHASQAGESGEFDERAILGVLSGAAEERSGPLSIGDEGDRVRRLQVVLAELGCFEGEIDGVYGMMTAEAVRRYQSGLGLTEDGRAGIATLYALGLCSEEAEQAVTDEAAVLAAAIELHAGEEPFGARVAVGAVILERARMLGSLARGIAYYGEGVRSDAIDSRSYAAAMAAMAGMMPAEGALTFSREKPEGAYAKLGTLYFFN